MDLIVNKIVQIEELSAQFVAERSGRLIAQGLKIAFSNYSLTAITLKRRMYFWMS